MFLGTYQRTLMVHETICDVSNLKKRAAFTYVTLNPAGQMQNGAQGVQCQPYTYSASVCGCVVLTAVHVKESRLPYDTAKLVPVWRVVPPRSSSAHLTQTSPSSTTCYQINFNLPSRMLLSCNTTYTKSSTSPRAFS